jgi:hypothetical protein
VPKRFLTLLFITISAGLANMTTAAQTNATRKGTLIIGILTILKAVPRVSNLAGPALNLS